MNERWEQGKFTIHLENGGEAFVGSSIIDIINQDPAEFRPFSLLGRALTFRSGENKLFAIR